MVVFEKTGTFAPSALATQLEAAGIAVLGVTCTEDDSGNVTAVQIVCAEGTKQADVDTAVAAYIAPSPPPDIATTADADSVAATIVSENLAAANITPEELPTIDGTLLSEAQAAIPFFENAVANWGSLTSVQKDRVLYDSCRTHAALIRYLTGTLAA